MRGQRGQPRAIPIIFSSSFLHFSFSNYCQEVIAAPWREVDAYPQMSWRVHSYFEPVVVPRLVLEICDHEVIAAVTSCGRFIGEMCPQVVGRRDAWSFRRSEVLIRLIRAEHEI